MPQQPAVLEVGRAQEFLRLIKTNGQVATHTPSLHEETRKKAGATKSATLPRLGYDAWPTEAELPDDRSLASLLSHLDDARLEHGDHTAVISALEHDSRRVVPGGIFVAVPGFNTDGHDYLAQALAAGASAVLVQADRVDRAPASGPAVISVPDTRVALSRAAAWFFGNPSRELLVVGVTGTDGKTTTTHFLTSVFEAAGFRTARLGTVDTHLPGEEGKLGGRMSTPEAPEVHRILRRAVEAGCEVAIVESTSHGLALHRLADVEYDIAVLTNCTGDHLDFHETFEAYREAKALLFAALERPRTKDIQRAAIVNADDPSGNFMLARTTAAHLRFGFEARDVEVTARNVHLRADGCSFRLITPRARGDTIRPPALFNVANALAAASAAVAAGVPPCVRSLKGWPPCPVFRAAWSASSAGQPFEVIVDYAHTGDAVRKALEVLRAVAPGRLIIVIGAAGERDPGRRFGVGRAAAEGADFAIFTSEDPRREDPAAIVHEIGRHAESAGRVRARTTSKSRTAARPLRQPSGARLQATSSSSVARATSNRWSSAQRRFPWDDRQVAREELAKLGFA